MRGAGSDIVAVKEGEAAVGVLGKDGLERIDPSPHEPMVLGDFEPGRPNVFAGGIKGLQRMAQRVLHALMKLGPQEIGELGKRQKEEEKAAEREEKAPTQAPSVTPHTFPKPEEIMKGKKPERGQQAGQGATRARIAQGLKEHEDFHEHGEVPGAPQLA